MKGPRGSLGAVFEDGATIAQSRLEAIGQYLDHVAEVDEPASGGVLSNEQFRTLLRNSDEFREGLAEKAAFATPEERKRLAKKLDELFPSVLPDAVSQIPPNPWES